MRATVLVAGAEIDGGARALMVRATLRETERLSPASVSEIVSESEPEKRAAGW